MLFVIYIRFRSRGSLDRQTKRTRKANFGVIHFVGKIKIYPYIVFTRGRSVRSGNQTAVVDTQTRDNRTASFWGVASSAGVRPFQNVIRQEQQYMYAHVGFMRRYSFSQKKKTK